MLISGMHSYSIINGNFCKLMSPLYAFALSRSIDVVLLSLFLQCCYASLAIEKQTDAGNKHKQVSNHCRKTYRLPQTQQLAKFSPKQNLSCWHYLGHHCAPPNVFSPHQREPLSLLSGFCPRAVFIASSRMMNLFLMMTTNMTVPR